MDKQKELLKGFLIAIGNDEAKADEVVSGFFVEDGEPTFPVDDVLAQAQVYARPFVEKEITEELTPKMQGRFYNDYHGKFAQASGGLITRRELEGKTPEEAVALYKERLGAKSGDAELQKMVDLLNDEKKSWLQEKENWESEIEEKVNAVRNEYAGKERERTNLEKMLTFLSKDKKIPAEVDQAHAARQILRNIGDLADLEYDETKKDFVLYEKGTRNVLKKSATELQKFNDLVDEQLKLNNWVVKSNGGTGGGQRKPDLSGKEKPAPNKSLLGKVYEETGAYEDAA